MSRRSRGCLRCRQRRVKCDEDRPSCRRCLNRGEVCVGYREESDLVFMHETTKITERAQSRTSSLLSDVSQSSSAASNFERATRANLPRRSRSLERESSSPSQCSPSFSIRSSVRFNSSMSSSSSTLPWLRKPPEEDIQAAAAQSCLDRYVLHPCTETSTPGFLEHLPSMFKEVNVSGRFALRHAVQASGAADLSRRHPEREQFWADEALRYYGKALGALGSSLGQGKEVDDYDLMTVVVLDLFETLFLPYSPGLSSHAEGMAHILRLRGHEQFSDPRGWSLFMLAHHRVQQQQLAKQKGPLAESEAWFEKLNTNHPHVRAGKNAHRISQVCQEARDIFASLQDRKVSPDDLLRQVHKMYELDAEAARWREGDPRWSFKTLRRHEVEGDEAARGALPPLVELHPDLWMSYEWNYHRTARILLHQQVLQCLSELDTVNDGLSVFPLSIDEEEAHRQVTAWTQTSLRLIHKLADEVLSTVPQSFGDIDRLGRCVTGEPPQSQAIGAYFLLWPSHVIRGNNSRATEEQKVAADGLFARIRECTGMRSELGSLSDVRRF